MVRSMAHSARHGFGVSDGSVRTSSMAPIDDSASALWTAMCGPRVPSARGPRILGVFAHPDDEVFCVGGTIARCAVAGAVTGIVSLTSGEGGQIRDVASATRRTLGAVRAKELEASAAALGVDNVTCLDLGDGRLAERPLAQIAEAVRAVIDEFAPDTIVTFGPDGGSGHPDHVVSCLATLDAVRAMAEPPRVMHAKFPPRGQLMVDMIVDWLVTQPRRSHASVGAAHALRLFADGTSMLGVAADHVRLEWYPRGSFIIEQDEPATELFCLLSGSADVVVERDDGSMHWRDSIGVGGFAGEDGLATGRPRNAHVIARESVTCLVLSPRPPSNSAGRGEGAATIPTEWQAGTGPGDAPGWDADVVVDVTSTLDRKVAALTAHRSQYALEPDLLPLSMLERLLGTEHFDVAAV
jgi:LmbE family N-acetylglucosaminyl deacetylase